jgi:hypothetical protein
VPQATGTSAGAFVRPHAPPEAAAGQAEARPSDGDGEAAGRALWTAITRRDRRIAAPEAARLRPAAARLAALTSPALADYLLDGLPVLDAADVARDRLANRFRRRMALDWAARIAAEGIEAVWLKGLATAHRAYPDPDIRPMTDADLLVREADLARLVSFLTGHGFAFRKMPAMPRWGLISDASFRPLVSDDGTVNLDIHIRPDDFPVHRTLTTEDVFAASRALAADGVALRVPCDDHLLLLAFANAVRDKFTAGSLKSVLDAVVMLTRRDARPDWAALAARAERAGWARAYRICILLLRRLGVSGLPAAPATRLRGPAAAEFTRVCRDFDSLFVREIGPGALLRRELLLTAAPRVILFKSLRRLRGLVKPWSGIPAD